MCAEFIIGSNSDHKRAEVAMATPDKSHPHSPEVALIPRFYNEFLQEISHPVQLAQLLLSDGIITNKTAETITSDEDVQHKRTLLDAIQDTVVHRPQPEETIRRLFIALEKTGFSTDNIRFLEEFVEGE